MPVAILLLLSKQIAEHSAATRVTGNAFVFSNYIVTPKGLKDKAQA